MTETPPPGPPSQNNPDIGQHAGMRLLLPVGRSGWAIAPGYLGLFSMLVIPAPLALITGIIAVKHIRKSQGSENPKHGMGRAIFGILFGAIFTGILIWALIASATS
tara:strand:- start:569 stop:886 length:318 start_codon:yes stop_codon:yes gene_type:complete